MSTAAVFLSDALPDAAGWWRRSDLRLEPGFFVIRKTPRFREIAEKAPR